MVRTTLFTALGEMKAQMDDLEEIVAKEVSRQFQLVTLDLRTLYRCSKSRHQEDSGLSENSPPTGSLSKRRLAMALNLGEAASTEHYEDEVF
jgi:hypothetical protein